MGESTAGPASLASFLRVLSSASSQISLGMVGTPLCLVALGSSAGLGLLSCVFFISLLSLAGMLRPGCLGGDRAVFKCHENAIFKGRQKDLN